MGGGDVKQGSLSEGEGSVQWTSLNTKFRSAISKSKNKYLYFTKQPILRWRSTVLCLSLQQEFPALRLETD